MRIFECIQNIKVLIFNITYVVLFKLNCHESYFRAFSIPNNNFEWAVKKVQISTPFNYVNMCFTKFLYLYMFMLFSWIFRLKQKKMPYILFLNCARLATWPLWPETLWKMRILKFTLIIQFNLPNTTKVEKTQSTSYETTWV